MNRWLRRLAFDAALSHRKLRECLYLLGVLECLHGRFDLALAHLEELANGATDDGDIHMQCEALKWTAIVLIAQHGSTDKVLTLYCANVMYSAKN